jgi:hypothetical protein
MCIYCEGEEIIKNIENYSRAEKRRHLIPQER